MVGIVQAFGFISICIQNVTCFKKSIQLQIVEVAHRLNSSQFHFYSNAPFFHTFAYKSFCFSDHRICRPYFTCNIWYRLFVENYGQFLACGYINIVGWCCKIICTPVPSVTLCRYDKSTLCGCTVKTATGTEDNEL